MNWLPTVTGSTDQHPGTRQASGLAMRLAQAGGHWCLGRQALRVNGKHRTEQTPARECSTEGPRGSAVLTVPAPGILQGSKRGLDSGGPGPRLQYCPSPWGSTMPGQWVTPVMGDWRLEKGQENQYTGLKYHNPQIPRGYEHDRDPGSTAAGHKASSVDLRDRKAPTQSIPVLSTTRCAASSRT
jgi:hypothetical protein